MQQLIPTIEIGGRYLWHYGPVEFRCPHCGYQYYTELEPQSIPVIVLRKTVGMMCGICKRDLLNDDGWWTVNKAVSTTRGIIDGITCVPYTQLEEIKKEAE